MYAEEFQTISGLNISTHAAAMFKAKADIADLSAADVVLSDSKVFDVQVRRLRRVNVKPILYCILYVCHAYIYFLNHVEKSTTNCLVYPL